MALIFGTPGIVSGFSALFLQIRQMTTEKVLIALHGAGGTVIWSSFDETKEEALQAVPRGSARGIG